MQGGLQTSPPKGALPAHREVREETCHKTALGKQESHSTAGTEQTLPQKQYRPTSALHGHVKRRREAGKVGYFKLPFVMTPFDSPRLCERPPPSLSKAPLSAGKAY